MRRRVHRRWRGGCTRVPAVNKSTLGVGSAVVKLVSGMESKRSTKTHAHPETGILKCSTHFKKQRGCSHAHTRTAAKLNSAKALSMWHISLMKPTKKNKKSRGCQATSGRMLININKRTTHIANVYRWKGRSQGQRHWGLWEVRWLQWW